MSVVFEGAWGAIAHIIREGSILVMKPPRRPINPRQLEAFRGVMLTGSITAAGKLMSVSQPAVSRLIKDLEADLKLALFHREGPQLSPTQEAAALFRDVERYFVGSDRIRDAAESVKKYSSGQIRVASILTLAVSCLPKAVACLAGRYPGLGISVHSGASNEILNLISSGSVDVGFVASPPGRNDLYFEPLPDTEAVCLLPKAHPLAAKSCIEPSDLHQQPFVALAPSSLMRLQLTSILHQHGVQLNIRVESLFSATVVAHVQEGLGLAIIDPLAAGIAHPDKVRVRPFKPRIRYGLSVAYPLGGVRNPLLAELTSSFSGVFRSDIASVQELMLRV